MEPLWSLMEPYGSQDPWVSNWIPREAKTSIALWRDLGKVVVLHTLLLAEVLKRAFWSPPYRPHKALSFKGSIGNIGPLGSFKGNIGGNFKALLKAIFGYFGIFTPLARILGFPIGNPKNLKNLRKLTKKRKKNNFTILTPMLSKENKALLTKITPF